MSTATFDGDSIGPELSLADLWVPPHVGKRWAAVLGHEGRFETGAEWIEAMGEVAEAQLDRAPTIENLCYMADGNHTIDLDGEDGTDAFVCMLDPLVVPFLTGRPGTVTSTTPEDGESVTIEIGEDGVIAPENAVISLGATRNPAGGEPSIERVYQESCPYIHVFASVEEYERWADGVDAATTSVPVDVGVAVARELATELFGEAES
ncbi:MAG: organomercurial lyase [Haloarculaceae archaeon]